MKNIKTKRIVIIAVLVVLLAAGGIAAYSYAPLLAMKPEPTGKVDDTEITTIKNVRNNVYFIDTNEGGILIDAGSDRDGLIKSLGELAIEPDTVKHIFLTHTDYDHVASLDRFPNATIYIGENEKALLDGTTKRNATGGNSISEDMDELYLVKDGQTIQIGEHSITCISAPGHTPGSMLYLLDGSYLFTGDAFSVSGGEIAVHPFTMDDEAAKATILSIAPVLEESELVLTSHYGFFQPGEMRHK